MTAQLNPDPGPIVRRRSYWPTAVGSNIDLSFSPANTSLTLYPREIRVHFGGDLAVTYADGTSEIIKNIPSGAVFVDNCWVSIQQTNSTAFALSIGW